MGDHDGRGATGSRRLKLSKLLKGPAGHLAVQRGGRLVDEDDAGLVSDGSR